MDLVLGPRPDAHRRVGAPLDLWPERVLVHDVTNEVLVATGGREHHLEDVQAALLRPVVSDAQGHVDQAALLALAARNACAVLLQVLAAGHHLRRDDLDRVTGGVLGARAVLKGAVKADPLARPVRLHRNRREAPVDPPDANARR